VPLTPWRRIWRNRPRGSPSFRSLLRAWLTRCINFLLGDGRHLNEAEFDSYVAWRSALIHQRLMLGFRLGVIYFSTFSILIAFEEFSKGDLFSVRLIRHLMAIVLIFAGSRETQSLTERYLVPASTAEGYSAVSRQTTPTTTPNTTPKNIVPKPLSQGGKLPPLIQPKRPEHLSLDPVIFSSQFGLFLLLSTTISVVTNLPSHWGTPVMPDLKGWTLGFFSIAAVLPFRWHWHLISHLIAYVNYVLTNGLMGQAIFPEPLDPGQVLFDMVWISLMSTLVVGLYERLSRTEFEVRKQLRQEQRRSDQLLTNILPRSVADRLLTDSSQIADLFPEVTVLFADLVGFTPLASQLQPGETIELLNRMFSLFDQLAEFHGLEKIKTIGDAYMAAAGLPNPNPNHAAAAADMALAMQRAIEQLNQTSRYPLSIRVGLHSGPVVAGVIGLRKFAYDLWGDTVNVASRMESQGSPGKIQVTQAVFDRLGGEASLYRLTQRGVIAVKGRGDMLVYWLEEAPKN